ncbi:acyl-CoA N-acyltransferase [Gorgonomyces haynaldii]|nr:acyl-CoA N-acyltransferase [Gorgonomyces haynaldii]
MKVELVKNQEDLAKAHQVRIRVFCDEQGCPVEVEIDDKDPICTHWLLMDEHECVGTIRLVPISKEECALGRLAIDKQYRGKGLGRMLVEAMEEEAIKRGYKIISMHAQEPKIGFYKRFGYILKDTPVFMEDGLPHVEMFKIIN